MTPAQRYQQQIASGEFHPNPLQEQAVLALQALYEQLIQQQNNQPNLLKRLLQKTPKPIKGLYLWGSVGIGKTWLMDIFYESLALPKMRIHFHRFMQQVHQALKQLQGTPDPLKKIAANFAKQAKILCLDELLVNDITDAMLLANLLEALFAEGITLITTANVEPDNLYRNGLQRGRFLPAIALIKQHLNIFHLASDIDYRLRVLEQADTYLYPLNAQTEKQMQGIFQQLTHGHEILHQPLEILERHIKTLGYTGDVVWFEFNTICHVPRSQLDYLEIAKLFSTVLISNLPQIAANEDNVARYLINLVDVFYDARVKLIISAAISINELYPEGRFSFEFARTRSRLQEMQSHEYLQKEHFTR